MATYAFMTPALAFEERMEKDLFKLTAVAFKTCKLLATFSSPLVVV